MEQVRREETRKVVTEGSPKHRHSRGRSQERAWRKGGAKQVSPQEGKKRGYSKGGMDARLWREEIRRDETNDGTRRMRERSPEGK